MASNKNEALKLFLEHKGNITNRKIAEILGEKEKTISAWKSRGKWNVVLQENNCGTTAIECSTTSQKCSTTKKRGAPKGNQHAKGHGAPKGNTNAVGNNGGAPPSNKNAEKHGFFSRIFPDDPETKAIIESIDIKSPIEMLWENIVIQYTAIARAQRLMYVKNKNDLTKVLKRQKESSGMQSDSWEKEYELQFAWDKHASFLKAQSVAMKELSNMLARYEEMLIKDLGTEEQRLRLEKLKSEIHADRESLKLSKARLLLDIEKAKGENKDNQHVDALRKKMAERKMKHGGS